ncbi:class I SAM-dependent methyltransferase [Mobilicoccus massiliensis]|uniref:class I SAM-dependent methyltransferase n=1 Tax=Mobilicoccus massiliensis TaxID=1522310 RepID=UPI00069448D2|nr:class I SAM-dependent methyltransferase [Mobilicoccus massiliensis]
MATDFDAAAAEWDTPEKVERSRVLAHEILRRVPVQQDWVALDVGAGTGQLSWVVGPHVARMIVTDPSGGMLDVARTRAEDDPDRYDVRQVDLTSEPLGEKVDLVISAMTLHHVPDTQALLQALRETLYPGGWIALADLDADPENLFHDDDHDGHRGIDRDDLAARLRDLGFDDVTTETAATVFKNKHGIEREFSVFLATGRLPRT